MRLEYMQGRRASTGLAVISRVRAWRSVSSVSAVETLMPTYCNTCGCRGTPGGCTRLQWHAQRLHTAAVAHVEAAHGCSGMPIGCSGMPIGCSGMPIGCTHALLCNCE
eukprot:366488-Chlamydomonas_euryale.AAC.14